MRIRDFDRNRWFVGGFAVLAMGGVGCKMDDPPVAAQLPAVGSPFSTTEAGGEAGQVQGVGAVPGGAGGLAAGGLADAIGGPLKPLPDVPTVLYEIQKGDTLGKIAADHGTSVDMLRRLNGIEGSFIRYGQKLKVPGAAAPAELPGATAPTPPTAPVVPGVPEVVPSLPPLSAPGAASGFGFGGESTPRTTAPTRRDEALPLQPR